MYTPFSVQFESTSKIKLFGDKEVFPPAELSYNPAVEQSTIVSGGPAQIIEAIAPIGTTGKAFTVMFTVSVALHPVETLLPVTTYCADTVGEATTVAPAVVFNPVAGLHVYVYVRSVLLAVNVAESPRQKEVEVAAIVTGVAEFTTMVAGTRAPSHP